MDASTHKLVYLVEDNRYLEKGISMLVNWEAKNSENTPYHDITGQLIHIKSYIQQKYSNIYEVRKHMDDCTQQRMDHFQ